METREANKSIKLTKGYTMLMINEEILRLMDSFFIALVLLAFIVYINNLFRNLLFGLRLYEIIFLVLLHIHLLPPLLLCLPSPPYITCQTPLPSPSPSSCSICHTQHLISYPSPLTYPPHPIYISPRDCPESSLLMLTLYLFSNTSSSTSSTLPYLTPS